MRKYKIKPYRSYYHYKQRQKKWQIALAMGTVLVLASIAFVKLDMLQVLGAILPNKVEEQVDAVYFEQSAMPYAQYHTPDEVKAVYLPAGYMSQLDAIVALAETTEVNAVVIDIKDDKGYLTFDTDNEKLQHMIKQSPPIKDIEKVIDTLYKHDIYPIARIVTFKDNVMGSIKPERMIQAKSGGVYTTRTGEQWLSPYNEQNWAYILEICQEAVDLGFKEIQFDYVRFHESMTSERCALPSSPSKTEAITAFVDYAYDQLHAQGIVVSADVFGTIITSTIDAQIVGQDYKELIQHLDYICPMIYPSHYSAGSFGVQHPDLEPYEIVLGALQYSNNVIKEIPRENRRAEVRPWLQDFTASWVEPHQVYGDQQVQEQIDAARDALISEWIFWNAAGEYHAEGMRE